MGIDDHLDRYAKLMQLYICPEHGVLDARKGDEIIRPVFTGGEFHCMKDDGHRLCNRELKCISIHKPCRCCGTENKERKSEAELESEASAFLGKPVKLPASVREELF